MIGSILIYFLKTILVAAILFLYYLTFLRDKKFNQYNRFYLIGTVICSLIIPLMKAPYQISEPQTIIRPILENNFILKNTPMKLSNPVAMNSNFWIEEGIPLFYWLMATFFICKVLLSLLKITRMINNKTIVKQDHFTLIELEENNSPFSFFHFIFWNKGIKIDSEEGRQIIAHELVHIKERHSFDKLFLESITSFFWFNPFYYLIKKELSIIHEFMADQSASKIKGSTTYSELLLWQQFELTHSPLVNFFNHSPIKRRIMMLTKNKNKKLAYTTRVLALPLIFIAFTFFAKAQNSPSKHEQEIKLRSTTKLKEGEEIGTYQGKKIISIEMSQFNSTTKTDQNSTIDKSSGNVKITLEDNQIVNLTPDEASSAGIKITPPEPPEPPEPPQPPAPPRIVEEDLEEQAFYKGKRIESIDIKNIKGKGEAKIILEGGEVVEMSLKEAKDHGFYNEPPLPPLLPMAPLPPLSPMAPLPPDAPQLLEYYKGKKIIEAEIQDKNGEGTVKLKLADGEKVKMTIQEAKKEGLLK